jgi:hypothetical protein
MPFKVDRRLSPPSARRVWQGIVTATIPSEFIHAVRVVWYGGGRGHPAPNPKSASQITTTPVC